MKLKKILLLEIPKSELLNIWLSLFPMLLGVFLYSFLTVVDPEYIKLANEEYVMKMISVVTIIPIPLVTNLLLMGTPKIDPLDKNYQQFDKSYNVFRRTVIVFFDLLIVGTLVMLAGVEISIVLYTSVTIGCLLILIGAALRDAKQNYFFGIRTPWALLSEGNWNYTHAIAGNLYILSGLIIAILGALNVQTIILVSVTVVLVIMLSLVPFWYSYFYYKNHLKH